jgi:apolipoprotein N-acyltransferase
MTPVAAAARPPRSFRDGALIVAGRLGALVLASFLFACSFPNPVFENGVPFLAWISFVPAFWVASRAGWASSVLYGAFYGYLAYGLFNYWLSVFHPLAGIIVGLIYLTYFAVLFPLLKFASASFPKRGYVVQWLVWIAYEYLRTRGFLGYSYGISGYSQWQVLPLIQIASVFGVWGVCALVVFPSAYLAAALSDGLRGFKSFVAEHRVAPALWAAALVGILVFGVLSPVDYSGAPTKRVALVQHNTDPWRGGIDAYRDNYRTLKRLSEEAVAADPKPDLVVWSETAFVPRIYWHKTYRDDPESYALVKELLDFLATQDVPYVIGNDDGRKEVGESGEWERVDYNAVLLFDRGEELAAYRKLHLVPFTEHFPYRRQLPFVYDALVAADTHFWKVGAEATVFEAAGFRFSTPICFEDTFGYLSRRFVRNGAQVIVNLTNDAWANSLSSQMQHGTMAVFRAVENRRTVVRSTASGQTCAIDPNGRILAMAEPFAETYLAATIPVYDEASTLYTFWGDAPVQILALVAALTLLGGVAGTQLTIYRRHRKMGDRSSER